MKLYLKNSRTSKLLLLITASIVFVFITNQVLAIEEASSIKALESAIFYDKNTGLEWLAGPDKPTNWFAAKKWVESLTAVAGGGWRMPTLKELKTLYRKGEKCNIKPFLKTTGCWAWSVETKDSSSAWGFDYSYNPSEPYQFASGAEVWFKRDHSSDFTRGFAVRSHK
jgi:hypothetical protein